MCDEMYIVTVHLYALFCFKENKMVLHMIMFNIISFNCKSKDVYIYFSDFSHIHRACITNCIAFN